ncbi:MAG: putative heme transporter [Frankiales bacterium]|nr:putative heme transporter [Frankiales bacterium]
MDEVDATDPGPVPTRTGLRGTALTCAELLVVGLFVYVVARLAERLLIVVVPFGVAVLVSALLRPAVLWLRRQGLPPALATWITVLAVWTLFGLLAWGVTVRSTAEMPKLITEATNTLGDLRDYLVNGPLHLQPDQIDKYTLDAQNYLKDHQAQLTKGVISGAGILFEVLTGAILSFFVGFFLLYDGEAIFGWVTRQLPAQARVPFDRAGRSAWRALAGYVRGTLIVALFHGVAMGIALTVMGVPLALPLAVLVAIGSLVPLAGALVAGGLAVLVTLATQGPLVALILVGVLVAENQAEAHILQPFVVGRYVHLHPLAIALVLTSGTVLAGLWGAVFAVPFTAATWAAVVALRQLRAERESAAVPPELSRT